MIDQMAYNYQTGTNKLTHIGDLVADNAFTYDIDNQSTNNYTYDAIGNLTQDVKGGLSSIVWNPYGKITHISKGSNGNLYYDYDAMGNRIKKSFTQSNDNADKTWYVRDAQGNIMAIYSRKNYGTNQQLLLENYELYGSSRLGSLNLGIPVEGDYNLMPTTNYTRSLGLKQYELSNHLGNVLTTFSDQRVFAPAGMSSTNSNALIAKLISAQDYYPFGMLMAGRSWNTDKYSFGFNGQEKDNEISGVDGVNLNFKYRMYDARVARFFSIDPLSKSFPWWTPYQFSGLKPIAGMELEGLETAYTASTEFGPMWEITASLLGKEDLFRDSKTGNARYYCQQELIRRSNEPEIQQHIQNLAIIGAMGLSSVASSTIITINNIRNIAITSAVISGGLTAAKGGSPYEIFKSTISGFFGGAALAYSPTTFSSSTFFEIMGVGTFSGLISNATDQTIDNMFGKSAKLDVNALIESGAYGAFFNTLSTGILTAVRGKISEWVNTEHKTIDSKKYYHTIRKEIMKNNPRMGARDLKNAINNRLAEQHKLIDAQGTQLNAAVEKTLETGNEQLQQNLKNGK